MTHAPQRAATPAWYHGWTIVAFCIVSQIAVVGLPINLFSFFAGDWSKDLGSPISTLALAMPGWGVAYSLLSVFVGDLAERHSARSLFAVGLLIAAGFYGLVASVGTALGLIASYAVLLAIACSLATSVTCSVVISRWFTHRAGLALGLTTCGMNMGGIVLMPVVATTLPQFGWRAIWLVCGAVIVLVIAPLALFILRDRPEAGRDDPRYAALSPGAAVDDDGQAEAPIHTYGEIFARPNFWLLLGVVLPLLSSYMAVLLNFAPILHSKGISETATGFLFSLSSLSALASNLGSGLLADRFGNRAPLLGMSLASAVGVAVLAIGPANVTLLAAATVLTGLAGGIWTLVAAAVGREFGRGRIGRVFGLFQGFGLVTMLAGFLLAKSDELLHSYTAGLLTLSVMTLGGVGASILMRERLLSDRASTIQL